MAEPSETSPLVTFAEARALLLAAINPLGSEAVPIGAGLAGRVLAESVMAPHHLPPDDNSAMDGYALRASDAGHPLTVAFRISAGDDPSPLPDDRCAAIATGAVLPAGADTVVPVERAREVDGVVTLNGVVRPGDNVRRRGADVAEGDQLLGPGVRLTPLAVSSLAAAGAAFAVCARRPRVAVLVTGDELVTPGAPLARGQVHESNSVLLEARLTELGADIVGVERVADTLEATTAAFAAAMTTADLVVSSGGVSVGPRDHVKGALAALGVEQLFWRVAIQPGKPIWAGRRKDAIVLGLPGNPLSVLVGLELLGRPALRRLGGEADLGPGTIRRRLTAPVRPNSERLRAIPARLGDSDVTPLSANMSHQVGRAAAADALILVDAGLEEAQAGEYVDAVPFGAWR